MTPNNGTRPVGIAKALAGVVFLIAAAGIATFLISATWSVDTRVSVPRTVTEAR